MTYEEWRRNERLRKKYIEWIKEKRDIEELIREMKKEEER